MGPPEKASTSQPAILDNESDPRLRLVQCRPRAEVAQRAGQPNGKIDGLIHELDVSPAVAMRDPMDIYLATINSIDNDRQLCVVPTYPARCLSKNWAREIYESSQSWCLIGERVHPLLTILLSLLLHDARVYARSHEILLGRAHPCNWAVPQQGH